MAEKTADKTAEKSSEKPSTAPPPELQGLYAALAAEPPTFELFCKTFGL